MNRTLIVNKVVSTLILMITCSYSLASNEIPVIQAMMPFQSKEKMEKARRRRGPCPVKLFLVSHFYDEQMRLLHLIGGSTGPENSQLRFDHIQTS